MVVDILPEDAPTPRLCHLIKWPDFDGYGFNLHAERSNPGQFIGKIDDDSPALMAGLREGDRIIEVNGVNINNENHRQVVERIKSDPNETRLLVVDPDTDHWYKEQDIVVKSSQLNVVYMKTPVPRPEPDSPRAKLHTLPSNKTGEESPADSNQSSQTQVAAQNTKMVDQRVGSMSPSTFNSSLESGEFNEEDSIEQHQNNNNVSSSNNNNNNSEKIKNEMSPREQAPMSPDSGKGDETVVVAAEINRSTPPALATQEERRLMSSIKNQDEASKPEVDSLSSNKDHHDVKRQTHNRSADSGKSSGSPTSKSSRSNSSSSSSSDADLADSLENPKTCGPTIIANDKQAETGNNKTTTTPTGVTKEMVTKMDGQNCVMMNKSTVAVETAKNNGINNLASDSSNDEKSFHNKTSNENGESKVETSDTPVADASQQQQPDCVGIPQQKQQQLSGGSSSPLQQQQQNGEIRPEESAVLQGTTNVNKTIPQQQQQVNSNSKTPNSNNYSGLNLNMTASEMRELIASRKKFDPKKAQINIRQKYEIIQQM